MLTQLIGFMYPKDSEGTAAVDRAYSNTLARSCLNIQFLGTDKNQ